VTRATPLAVDDAHAATTVLRRFGEKTAERNASLVLRHPVQVELVEHRIFAATQAPQRGCRNAFAAVRKLIAGLDVELGGIEGEGVGEHLRFVRAARGRARPPTHALGRPLSVSERPHVAHGGAKQLAILVLDLGTLRTRARARALTV